MKKVFLLHIVVFLMLNPIVAQWNSLNVPKANYETYQSVAVSDDGKNVFSYMSDLTGKAYFVSSHDYGSTWQSYEQAKVGYTIPTAPVAFVTTFWDSDVLYYVSADMSFRKSIDFGATTSVISSTARSLSFPILRLPYGNWYVSDAGYNWVSTNKGVSWTKTTGGIYGIAFVTANNGNIVALQNNTVIGYSLDGLTWNKSTVPAGIMGGGNTPRLSKAADGTILAYFYSTPTSFILKSTDHGLTFQLMNATIPANTNIMYYYENDIIAADILGTTHKSTDGGLTFTKINTTKLMNSFSEMITNGSNIYLYGMSDIYRYGSLKTGLVEAKSERKLAIYPNPSNGNFTIETNEALENSTIEICNSTGQRLYSQAINSSKSIINSNLKSGIYFVNISDMNGVIQTKKVIVK